MCAAAKRGAATIQRLVTFLGDVKTEGETIV
jgi:hypothetical protein